MDIDLDFKKGEGFYWKISYYPYGNPLVCYLLFPLAAFNICSLRLIFVNLINMCLGVFCLGFILFGTLCVSWTWVIISFPILGKFSTIISSSIFSWSFFLSSSSGTPMIWMLGHLTLSQRSLRLYLFLLILFPFSLSASFISTILSSTSLILSSVKADSLPTEPPGNHKGNQMWTRWLFTVCLPQQTLGVPTSCKS